MTKRFKSTLVILLGLGLASLFFFYAGAFRDTRNPLSVVDYYYACMANHEPFLIYAISDRRNFDYLAARDIMAQYFLKKIDDIHHEIVESDADRTLVMTRIAYRDQSVSTFLAEMKNRGDSWIVNPNIRAVRNGSP